MLLCLLVASIVAVGAARGRLAVESRAALLAEPVASAPRVAEERALMGTRWAITALAPLGSSPARLREAVEAAFAEVARVEAVMSEWRPDSPVSAVNAAAGAAAVAVPEELHQLLLRAVHFSELTRGAFDVTWRGLDGLWRLRDPDFRPPHPDAVAAALERVGYRHLTLAGSRVGLARPGMSIGLGAIAKGYGVDRAAEVLSRAGIDRFFVQGGGDTRVSGGRAPGEPWRIGIRDPRGGRDDLLAILEVEAGAVATSGDYERYREVGGVRYHHILDPRTGSPATLSRASTVVAPTAEAADALATGVFVLGASEGLAVLAQQDATEGMVVDRDGRLWMTRGFRALASRLDVGDAQ